MKRGRSSADSFDAADFDMNTIWGYRRAIGDVQECGGGRPVATIVGMIAEGMSQAEILQAYPDLTAEDMREALAFAGEALRERALPLGGLP